MKTFLLKTFFVISVFFIGMLIGSLHSRSWQESTPYTREISDKKEEADFSLFPKDEAEVDLHIKKERLEKEETVNVFSKAGQSLADAVTFAARSLFDQ
ncbi:hypothetical protein [Pseudobacillus wudalianchiensis]|uniref:DUF3679 domain-containing protein n=1 Tax=Pseudobacillus wudalianchiensis TaxID=1743143 RepID=A0A1B9B8T5_9BACI|nr:hypothetical protein [Bacillus wudalianchiensis]OCA92498.1 hypothetical protein A8F95_01990 [Bacillus wudalianchiensis]